MLAMISVSAGYGTDGSSTPTMVAALWPRRTVFPNTAGSLFNTVDPEVIRQHHRACCLWPVVAHVDQSSQHRMQPHHVEIRAAHHPRAHLARLAQPDHREANGGEIADRAERLDPGPKILNLRNRKRRVIDR